MTDEHALTGDGSTGDRPASSNTDDGLIGRPTTPSGFILSGVLLILAAAFIFIAAASNPRDSDGLWLSGGLLGFLMILGLGGVVPLLIGTAAAGVRLAERERDRELAQKS